MPTDPVAQAGPSTQTEPPGRRDLILGILRRSVEPRGISSLAEELDVHPNTVRFHLDALVGAGRVERVLRPARGPGRPPVGYRIGAGMDRTGSTNYRLLAAMLASHLTESTGDPVQEATSLGRTWGSTVLEQSGGLKSATSRRSGHVRISKATSLARLVEVLADLGFEPQPAGPRDTEIRLRHCPFLDLIPGNAEVICSLHLGLMQGTLAALNSSVTMDLLEPFVEPDLCVARVVPVGAPV